MPRGKQIIANLGDRNERCAKFSKRKDGFLKKAKELSILTETDVALLMFSPAGKPYYFVSENRELSNIVEKLANASAMEREASRRATMEKLREIYIKSGQSIDPESLMDKNQLLLSKLSRLQEQRAIHENNSYLLRCFKNPESINDIETSTSMENIIMQQLDKIKLREDQLSAEANGEGSSS